MQEVWKDVVGFEEYFRVSNLGRVYGKRSGKVLRQCHLLNGYMALSTRIGGRDGQTYHLRTHKLVADAFLEPPSAELVTISAEEGYGVVLVRHLDGIKTNNTPDNLAWGCYADNLNDFKDSTGYVDWKLAVQQANKLKSKLTEEDVEEIRRIYKPRCKINGARALAVRFGVHHAQVSRIINNKTYQTMHVS